MKLQSPEPMDFMIHRLRWSKPNRRLARAHLPDGEIVAGTPIPAVVPLPGKAHGAPLPGRVYVAGVDKDGDGTPESSQAVDGSNRHRPGFD